MHRVSKGAPEQILHLAHNKSDIELRVHAVIDKFAERGLRSLAVAIQQTQYPGCLPSHSLPIEFGEIPNRSRTAGAYGRHGFKKTADQHHRGFHVLCHCHRNFLGQCKKRCVLHTRPND